MNDTDQADYWKPTAADFKYANMVGSNYQQWSVANPELASSFVDEVASALGVGPIAVAQIVVLFKAAGARTALKHAAEHDEAYRASRLGDDPEAGVEQ